jgi:hypothetical protein
MKLSALNTFTLLNSHVQALTDKISLRLRDITHSSVINIKRDQSLESLIQRQQLSHSKLSFSKSHLISLSKSKATADYDRHLEQSAYVSLNRKQSWLKESPSKIQSNSHQYDLNPRKIKEPPMPMEPVQAAKFTYYLPTII